MWFVDFIWVSSLLFFGEKVFSFHRNLLNDDDNAKIFIPKTFPPLHLVLDSFFFVLFMFLKHYHFHLLYRYHPHLPFNCRIRNIYVRYKFRGKSYNWSFVLRCLLKFVSYNKNSQKSSCVFLEHHRFHCAFDEFVIHWWLWLM